MISCRVRVPDQIVKSMQASFMARGLRLSFMPRVDNLIWAPSTQGSTVFIAPKVNSSLISAL